MSTNITQSKYFDVSHFDKNLVIHHQLSVPQLVEKALENNEGTLANNGALAIDTGEFTGRSPKDRFIVEDVITTGKSSMECAQVVKKLKGNVIGFACIVDRSNKQSSINLEIVSQITFDIPVFKANEIPSKLKSIPAIKPGSRNLI